MQRLLSIVAIAGLIFSGSAGQIHDLLVSHEFCSAHGELTHGGAEHQAHDGERPSSEETLSRATVSSEADHPHEHHHCSIALCATHKKYCSAVSSQQPQTNALRAIHRVINASPAADPLTLAPKQSPPSA